MAVERTEEQKNMVEQLRNAKPEELREAGLVEKPTVAGAMFCVHDVKHIACGDPGNIIQGVKGVVNTLAVVGGAGWLVFDKVIR